MRIIKKLVLPKRLQKLSRRMGFRARNTSNNKTWMAFSLILVLKAVSAYDMYHTQEHKELKSNQQCMIFNPLMK